MKIVNWTYSFINPYEIALNNILIGVKIIAVNETDAHFTIYNCQILDEDS